MRREDIILETSLGRLLEAYADHCRRMGFGKVVCSSIGNWPSVF